MVRQRCLQAHPGGQHRPVVGWATQGRPMEPPAWQPFHNTPDLPRWLGRRPVVGGERAKRAGGPLAGALRRDGP
eukprot:3845433-Alexandrium_andersonii.AAC.1